MFKKTKKAISTIHRANKKKDIHSYDLDDPFIDDSELVGEFREPLHLFDDDYNMEEAKETEDFSPDRWEEFENLTEMQKKKKTMGNDGRTNRGKRRQISRFEND